MWSVICWADKGVISACYGPFDSQDAAERFAEFLRTEVDPATVEPLHSPLDEVLRWREAVRRDA
jgi:hypothetical protein